MSGSGAIDKSKFADLAAEMKRQAAVQFAAIEWGSGKGIKLENYFSTQHNRRRKIWNSPTFHSQLHKLAEIIARNYSRAAMLTIAWNKDDNFCCPKNILYVIFFCTFAAENN